MKLPSTQNPWWSVALVAATLVLTIGFGLTSIAAATPANPDCTNSPGTSGTCDLPQPPSTADQNNTGANDTSSANAYASTRHGAASDNGVGTGQATGEPCAACVGRADNKNPQGQAPDATDHNNGYECDGNNGIARTNPAHTGCTGVESSVCDTSTTDCSPVCDTSTSNCGSSVLNSTFQRRSTLAVSSPSASVLGETLTANAPTTPQALPRTGRDVGVLALWASVLLVAGAALTLASRVRLA